ncbi:MAG: sulfite exporter TauE/SafE family protein [Sulfurimonas sp.]|jgi:uncharacterized membrane protein YfcA|nr:sulfite exporter TauE/SafE family protein [Sulfurimonas sp.]
MYEIELIIAGIATGFLSGFFGIGGGTILVPLLLLMGVETKAAIGISVVQMVFSSLYGSYLNKKFGTLDVKLVAFIGVGGFIGAQFSGVITAGLSAKALEFIFLGFALFALVRLFMKPSELEEQKEHVHPLILLSLGFVLGVMSMAIGVGGSIILTPILVGFFHFPLKNAISAGLFFVVFSSISGVISQSMSGNVDYLSGLIVGIASLAGVYLGIIKKDIVTQVLQRRLIVFFYLLIVGYMSSRVLS